MDYHLWNALGAVTANPARRIPLACQRAPNGSQAACQHAQGPSTGIGVCRDNGQVVAGMRDDGII
jgi:hypothetical protein